MQRVASRIVVCSMQNTSKIQTFTDLNAWKEGHKLVLMIYELSKELPTKETYILISQMLRAVVSVTSNIAEGFTRHTLKEKIQFYYMSQASLTELKNQLIICRDVNYIKLDKFDEFWKQTIIVHKLIQV